MLLQLEQYTEKAVKYDKEKFDISLVQPSLSAPIS